MHSISPFKSKQSLIYFIFASLLVITAFDSIKPGPDSGPATATEFVNFETPHVRPLTITPDGQQLLAVNTADNRLEVFQIENTSLSHLASIPVGMDPVTVKVLGNNQAWVVNHLSDNISIVDLTTKVVVKTLPTDNEPCDIVFAGHPQKAIVSCSEANSINIFDLSDLDKAPHKVILNGEEPRALAVSPDGNTVYAAFFESGNQSTAVPGGKDASKQGGRMKDAVRHPEGPYGGISVPPNAGKSFNPPIKPELDFNSDHPPPPVSIIVKKDKSGRWLDDNQGDWTRFISGDLASASHRVPGWDLPDRDVAIIDANNFSIKYQHQLMNILMAMDVHPVSGRVTVVGSDATNEIRFEPNLQGRFLRINWADFDGQQQNSSQIKDMNPHLDYRSVRIPLSQRNLSVSDPRGISWNRNGTRCYVSGMGTNNVIILDAEGNRLGDQPIRVGEGPTGIVLQEKFNQAYVLNKFSATISIIDLTTEKEISQVAFYDPTPEIIKKGRSHLYNATVNSGLGHIACASCHVDARTDRLAWDLGNPQGSVVWPDPMPPIFNQPKKYKGFHPMKGPLRTQTLQDLTRHPALHWRGDQPDLHAFATAYEDLQGDDAPKPVEEMEAFNAFLSTIYFPPNPYRNLDNSLADSVPINGANNEIVAFGRPVEAMGKFINGGRCVQCHPGQRGRIDLLVENFLHVGIYMQPESFRGFYERNGFYSYSKEGNNAGFGKLPDGTEFFDLGDMQLSKKAKNDIQALLMSFDGGVPWAEETDQVSLDAHAAVGQQVTVNGKLPPTDQKLLESLLQLGETEAVGIIVKGIFQQEYRGFTYLGNYLYQADRSTEIVTHKALMQNAVNGSPLTFTAVPWPTRIRTGIDRDSDGVLDGDEQLAGRPAPLSSSVAITASEGYELYFNGIFIGENTLWQTAEIYHQLHVLPGKNVLAVKAENRGEMAGLLAELKVGHKRFGSDEDWKVTSEWFRDWKEINFNDQDWPPAMVYASFGEGAWGKEVIPLAYDTPAKWIWSPQNEQDSLIFARFTFNGQTNRTLDDRESKVLFTENFDHNLYQWMITQNALIENGQLHMSDNELIETSGGEEWTDYTVSTSMNIEQGNAGIALRYVDDQNYYFWNFNGRTGSMMLLCKTDNKWKLLKGINLGLRGQITYQVMIKVKGNIFSTYINNQLVDLTVDDHFRKGKIALGQSNFKPTPGRAVFDNVLVKMIPSSEYGYE